MGVNVKFLGAASVKLNIKGEHQTNTLVFSDDLGICSIRFSFLQL